MDSEPRQDAFPQLAQRGLQELILHVLAGGISGYYELWEQKAQQGSLLRTSTLVEYTLYVPCTGTYVLFILQPLCHL